MRSKIKVTNNLLRLVDCVNGAKEDRKEQIQEYELLELIAPSFRGKKYLSPI